ncbi:LlaJI family restriction endonuclease [Staphylococcus haemolyticus]|uniref:LlaJI family restriction endonuclease n=1 Tax=Staphylococcus haemolyticus TaxID=1283 RepID=UPI00069ED3A9|nr:LlaJI family restriction endonuclease [Staphylococcus haemolyticus]
MIDRKLYVIQDGEIIEDEIIRLFESEFKINDLKMRNDKYYSNFVGFIFIDDYILISFPKKYYNVIDINLFNSSNEHNSNLIKDMKILFNTLRKSNKRKIATNLSFSNSEDEGFPLEAFNYIYNYYLRYGLFVEEHERSNFGSNGKIDWKKTVSKSPIVVNNNNLIFMPLVTKDKFKKLVFISKCMSYVINYTSEYFSIFQNMKVPSLMIKDINWKNSFIIVKKLQKYSNIVFKDRERLLIRHLILFFQKLGSQKNALQLKTKSFDLIFEDIILDFLNFNFININKNGYIEYSLVKFNELYGFKKERFYPDFRKMQGWRIEPDFYLEENNNRYIFDSKYYTKITELNYKQLAYYFLLKEYSKTEVIKKTYNILILPTDRNNSSILNQKEHFKFNPEYNTVEGNFSVKEQYINMQFLLRNYVNYL